MNIYRLEQLINVMKRVEKYDLGFNIHRWYVGFTEEEDWRNTLINASDGIHKDYCNLINGKYKVQHGCGYKACVAGWLAVSSEYNDSLDDDMKSGTRYVGEENMKQFLECDDITALGVCGLLDDEGFNDNDEHDPEYDNFYRMRRGDITAKDVVQRLIELREECEE